MTAVAQTRRAWIAVAALTLIGLTLRLLAARGALWLDEAWSARFAEEAGTPLAVVWRINHDNNHILNTWWLQLLGPTAAPWAQRGLSILGGTIAIPFGALIARRQGGVAMIATGLALALSPFLVTYGSEARGYAPMLLAMIAFLLAVDRWLDQDVEPSPIVLAVIVLLGMLAQILLLPPLLAITGWAWLSLARRRGWRAATIATGRVLGPALGAALMVLAIMAAAAGQSQGGFRFGSYAPFTWADWVDGLTAAWTWGLGAALPAQLAALLVVAVMTAVLWTVRGSPRLPLYLIMIVAYPLAFAVFHVGNVGIPRFYLTTIVIALVAIAEAAGMAWQRGGIARGAVIVLGGLALVGSLSLDRLTVHDRRSDAGIAIDAMRAAMPHGAEVMVPDQRFVPVAQWAARASRYPLTIVGTGCTQAPFLWIDKDRPSPMARTLRLCCGTYRLIAARRARALSGTDWWLYARVPRS